jgi:hypothetical protein
MQGVISMGGLIMRFDRRLALAAVVMSALVCSSVALGGGGVAGKYTTTIKSPAELKGQWGLAFARGGTYSVSLNGKPVARGTYSATATTITFVRETGSGCSGPGSYVWKRSGKAITFVRKRESPSCQGRAAVLGHRFTQVR